MNVFIMKPFITQLVSQISILLAVAILGLSSGCSIIKKQGVDAHIEIISSDFINPDHNNESRPLNITLFYLTDSGKFLLSEYFDLFKSEGNPLENTLIHKSNILLLPNNHQFHTEEIPEDIRAIGVVYQFRQLEKSQWLALVPTPKTCFFGLNCKSILHNSKIFISVDELDTKIKLVD